MDVLFILDESNSMGEWWGYQKRITAAKNSIGQITGYGNNNGLSDNKNLDVQYALVGFGGGDSHDAEWNWGWDYSDSYKDAGVEQTWTSSPNDVYNKIPDITYSEHGHSTNRYGGGTNYEAGFRTGKEVLDGARDDAMKVVIFISDGGPGYYYNDLGGTRGTGNPSNYDSTALQHGIAEVKTLTGMSNFYFVGVTGDVTSKVYTDIRDAAPVPQANKQAISAANPDDLLDAFKNIQSDISHFAAKDVTITDPLSQYADLVLTDGEPQLRITVKHGERTWSDTVGNNGTVTFQDADGHDQTATARVSSDNRTIYLDLPDDYELEEGYTYSISTVIAPSQLAKDAGMDSDAAKQTPDDNTGTHSEANPKQQGFWSNDNDNAEVTYTANGEKGSKNFPKPVIQAQEPSEFIYTAHLALKKSLPGGVLDADHKFTFQLTDLSQGAEKATFKTSPDAEGKTCVETDPTEPSACTVTNKTSDGSEADLNDFGKVTFPGPGVYMFKVNEVQPDPSERDNGIVYDEHALYVLYVIGKDNKMARYIHYDGSGEEDVTAPCSTNEGCSPSDNVWVPAGSDIVSEATSVTGIEGISEKLVWTNHLKVSALPLTGGDATARNVLLAGGGVLLLAGGAWLLARRRRV